MSPNVPAPTQTFYLVRLPEVLRATGLSKTRLYMLQRVGGFPEAVQLHGRAVAWRSDEIDAWITSRPRAGRSTRNTNAPGGKPEASNSAHVRA